MHTRPEQTKIPHAATACIKVRPVVGDVACCIQQTLTGFLGNCTTHRVPHSVVQRGSAIYAWPMDGKVGRRCPTPAERPLGGKLGGKLGGNVRDPMLLADTDTGYQAATQSSMD